jgi:hypothetical protein
MSEEQRRDLPSDGWSAHEAEQRRAWARTTARQRLEWLEQAKRFAARAAAAVRVRGPDSAPDPE